jgi:hypothetical protein
VVAATKAVVGVAVTAGMHACVGRVSGGRSGNRRAQDGLSSMLNAESSDLVSSTTIVGVVSSTSSNAAMLTFLLGVILPANSDSRDRNSHGRTASRRDGNRVRSRTTSTWESRLGGCIPSRRNGDRVRSSTASPGEMGLGRTLSGRRDRNRVGTGTTSPWVAGVRSRIERDLVGLRFRQGRGRVRRTGRESSGSGFAGDGWGLDDRDQGFLSVGRVIVRVSASSAGMLY